MKHKLQIFRRKSDFIFHILIYIILKNINIFNYSLWISNISFNLFVLWQVPPDDDRLELYPDIRHPHGLMSSTLGLRFTVTGDHFFQGSMRLRCVAEVSPVLWQGDRESVVQRMTSETIREALFLGITEVFHRTQYEPCGIIFFYRLRV